MDSPCRCGIFPLICSNATFDPYVCGAEDEDDQNAGNGLVADVSYDVGSVVNGEVYEDAHSNPINQTQQWLWPEAKQFFASLETSI